MFLRMGLTRRLIFFALVCVVVPLAATAFIATTTAKRAIQQEVLARNLLYTKTLAKRVDAMLSGLTHELALALTTGGENVLNVEALRPRIEATLGRQRLLRYVRLVDADGKVVLHLPYPRTGDVIPPVGTAFQIAAWSKTPYYSDVYGAAGGQIILAVPVLGTDDRFLGAALAAVEPAALDELLREVPMGKSAFALLVDRYGTIAGDSSGRWNGQSLTAHNVGRDLYLERFGAREEQFQGVDTVLTFQPLGLMPWGLVVGEPLQDALAPVSRLSNVLAKGFLVIVLLGVAGVLLGSLRVVRPLRQLIALANDFRQGMLWRRAEVSGDGEVSSLARTMNEMAEAIQRERQTVLSKEQYLGDLLQGIPYCIITTDTAGRVTFLNRAAEELTGWSAAEAVGQLTQELPFKERPDDWVLLETLQSQAAVLDRETYVLDRAGQRHIVQLQATKLWDREGRQAGAVAVFRSITELRELESLVQRNERLAALGQLTAGIGHELKNPLAIISALTQMLQIELAAGGNPDSLVADLVAETQRMDVLLRDLLEFSRGSSAKLSSCWIGEVLGDLTGLLRHRIVHQRIVLSREFEPNLAPVVGDRARLRQAFLNILVNALDAMPTGGTLTIRAFSVERNGRSGISVLVSDTGAGIPERRLERIFNPFYSTKQEGTGLGLAIVNEIITQHDGLVTAESVEGQGTTMICWLPLSGPEEERAAS